MLANVRAVIDFEFEYSDDMNDAEILSEIEDRIRSGEYFPRNVVNLTIDASGIIRKGA